MQRSDYQVYDELLDVIVTAKQEAYIVLLNAFQQGIKDGIDRYPYEQEKGLIFKTLWQYLDSLSPDHYQLPYPVFQEAIPLASIITKILTQRSNKQDISSNKKDMLYQSARLFYDLQRVYLLLKQGVRDLTANKMHHEASIIFREYCDSVSYLQQCQASLSESAPDQQGLLSYDDFYAGMARLAALFRLEQLPGHVSMASGQTVSPVFACLISLGSKIQKGSLAAAFKLYETEQGLPREKDYRNELRAFADRLVSELKKLKLIIDRLTQRYEQFKSGLARCGSIQQQLDRRAAVLHAHLAWAEAIKALQMSSEIIAVCRQQSSCPKILSDGMGLLLHENIWHEAASKLESLLQTSMGKLSVYTDAFSEDYVSAAMDSMEKAKRHFHSEYGKLNNFAQAITIWQQVVAAIEGQVGVIRKKTKSKQCCLFPFFNSEPAYEPLLKRHYLDLCIPEDIAREAADMVNEMAAYEQADSASSSRFI